MAVSSIFGTREVIASGYRSPELSEAIGSKATSQHCLGEAADFEIAGVSNLEVALWIQNHCDFDQLILEFWKDGEPNSGWIHCSYKNDGTNRKTALIINKYTKGKYLPWKP